MSVHSGFQQHALQAASRVSHQFDQMVQHSVVEMSIMNGYETQSMAVQVSVMFCQVLLYQFF